jgi:hypothetical protein
MSVSRSPRRFLALKRVTDDPLTYRNPRRGKRKVHSRDQLRVQERAGLLHLTKGQRSADGKGCRMLHTYIEARRELLIAQRRSLNCALHFIDIYACLIV